MIILSSGCVSNSVYDVLENSFYSNIDDGTFYSEKNSVTFSSGGISFVHPASWYKLDPNTNVGPNTENLGDFVIKNATVVVDKYTIYDVESVEKFKNLTKNDLKKSGSRIIYDKKAVINSSSIYYLGINNTDHSESVFVITGQEKIIYMIQFNGNVGEVLSRTKEIEHLISTIKLQ
jgi:hypothetical protein